MSALKKKKEKTSMYPKVILLYKIAIVEKLGTYHTCIKWDEGDVVSDKLEVSQAKWNERTQSDRHSIKFY